MAITPSENTTSPRQHDGAQSGAHEPEDRAQDMLPASLANRVQETAERWADQVLARARLERRHICGGWPGTLSEARALLAVDLLPRLTGESRRQLERVGRDRVARILYQGARGYWRRRETRNVEDGT